MLRLPGGPTTRTDARGRKVSGTRLRKLVCSDDCGYPPLRVSRAAIDAGLPTCRCGAIFWPWDLDDLLRAVDAGHLSEDQLGEHPLWLEYQHQCGSVGHGQAWTGKSRRADGTDYETPEAKAAYRVAAAVSEQARANKLASARALRVEEPMPF